MLQLIPLSKYERLCEDLCRAIRKARAEGRRVGLKKSASNLFRRRRETGKMRLDVRGLCHVLAIDETAMTADVEGAATYEALAAETLRHGLLPAVTPELKTITTGGAVSGLGIESSSFRFGLVHETVIDMDVLTGRGDVVRCSRDTNSDLFYCVPNSYGTLGYVLRLRLKLMPAKAYVRLTHTAYSQPEEYFEAIAGMAESDETDFIDGTVFGAGDLYLTTAMMHEETQRTSDYTWLHAYYASIRSKRSDCLKVRDYVWRWDTDWFWCSKQFRLQNPVLRFLATPLLLNSRTYQRLMRLSHVLLPEGKGRESVIQDVAIPIGSAAAFLRFLLTEIPITPVWVCPFFASRESAAFTVYPIAPGLHINFGFWDVVPALAERAYYNRLVEKAVGHFGGRKAFYSTSCYSPETFRSLFDERQYRLMKQRYDPDGLYGDLYDKCVLAG